MAISNSTDRFNGVVASLAVKVRCVVGVESNVTTPLQGISNPYEGVFVAEGDRVLLTAQTDPILNGVWNVFANGPWTRAADWDGNRDVEKGSTVWAGVASADDKLWQVQTAGVIQPGTTAQSITELLDPNSVGAIVGTTVDSTLRYDGVSDYVENLNLLVEADGRVTHPNAVPTRWLNLAAAPIDLLEFEEQSLAVAGVGSIVANFEGTDGDRVYTGEDGRVWTFGGSTGANEITNVEAKFGATSYLFGGQGVQDDNIQTDIEAEYTAGDFVMGTRDWYFRFWVWNDAAQIGGHDLVSISAVTTGTRAMRLSNNNNALSMAYAAGGPSENNFPVFGAGPTDGVWHEMVCERAGNGIHWYVDGVQSGSTFDCTGDDIGGGLTGDAVLIIGSSIGNGVAGITPSPTSYIDSFDCKIGVSLNGGVAPGIPGTQAPVADAETMVLGDPGYRTRIDGNALSINGAYDLPVADGTAGQALVTNGAGTVSFADAVVPVGTTEGALLFWDDTAAAWVEAPNLRWDSTLEQIEVRDASNPANIASLGFNAVTNATLDLGANKPGSQGEIHTAGQLHFINCPIFRIYSGALGSNNGAVDHNGNDMRIYTGASDGGVEMFANNGNEDIRFSFGTGIKIQEKAAAYADLAVYGQIWVRNDNPNTLMYTDGDGADYAISTGVVPVGTDDNEVLRWDAGTTAWVGVGTRFNVDVDTGAQTTIGTSDSVLILSSSSQVRNAANTFYAMYTDNNDFIAFSDPGFKYMTTGLNGGDLVMEFGNGAADLILNNGSGLYIVEKSAAHGDVLTRGQFWVRDDNPNTPMFTDDLGNDFDLTATGSVSFPLDALDNEQIRFGTGQDVTIDWDGIDLEIEGAAINQTINFRDGFHLRLWDSSDSDHIDIHHDGNDVNVTSGATASISFVDVNVRMDDNVELQFGTGNDASIRYDAVSSLDMDLITGDTFNIQEAGVDRFGFNHTNNRLELLTGNRLLAYSSDNLEWLEYYHDGSDGHIGTDGTNPGSIIFESAIVHILPTTTVSANAVTLNTEDSNGFEVDLEPATAAVIITLAGSPPTGYYVASLKVQQDGSSAQTISFAGGTIRNANAVQHPMNTTLDGISIYTLETWDGGTIWYIAGVDYS